MTTCERTRNVASARRGSVLLGVFAIVVVAALLATTLLSSARVSAHAAAASGTTAGTGVRTQSAIVALLHEFADQREDILEGDDPDLPAMLTLYEHADGARAVARLIAVRGSTLTPLNARIDANTASAATLARLPNVSEELAAAIVEARESEPFTSLADLLRVEGVSAQTLFGTSTVDSGNAVLSGLGDENVERPGDLPLVDVLTVFSIDPNVTALDGGTEPPGSPRVNMAADLDQPLRDELDRRIGVAFRERVEDTRRENDRALRTTAGIVNELLSSPDDPRRDSALDRLVFDTLTATGDPLRAGLVDVNRAGAAVLAAVLGVDEAEAQDIIGVRDSLDSSRMRTILWLWEEGFVSRGRLAELADLLTTRSTQWRVRIEVGVEPVSDSGLSSSLPGPSGLALAPGGFDDEDDDAGDLEHRRVYDVVIDLSEVPPRVAELRDSTHLDTALALAELAQDSGPDGGPGNLGEDAGAFAEFAGDAEDAFGSGGGGAVPDDFFDRRRERFAERFGAGDAGEGGESGVDGVGSRRDRGGADTTGNGGGGSQAVGGSDAGEDGDGSRTARRGRWTGG